MHTTRNSNDPKLAAVTEAIAMLNELGYKTLEIGQFVLDNKLRIELEDTISCTEQGTIMFYSIPMATYKL